MSEQAVTPEDVAAWSSYVGRSETRRQVLDIETLRRYAVATGSPHDVERYPPALAHWAYFLEVAPSEQLGPDGHPKRGGSGILPPIHLPRRMFAASSMRFVEPLSLGQDADLTLTVAEVKHRSGKSGDLVFVEVERLITQAGRDRVAERQTIVYRGVSQPVAPVEENDCPAEPGTELWTPGPVELFRFSAVTFNAHRIHYDLPYAQGEEGYPNLVVHGPLTAAKLHAFARARAGGPPSKFSFRANAPLFCGQSVRLTTAVEPGHVLAVRCDGVVAMSAQAEF